MLLAFPNLLQAGHYTNNPPPGLNAGTLVKSGLIKRLTLNPTIGPNA